MNLHKRMVMWGFWGGGTEDLTAELTEQDEFLTNIETTLGLREELATLTVNFICEGNDPLEDYTATCRGTCKIDDGEELYFEIEEGDYNPLILQARIGSVVTVCIPEDEDVGAILNDVALSEGCEVFVEEPVDYSKERVHITITEATALVVIQVN